MRVAVIVFPGTSGDDECCHALSDVGGFRPERVWHQEESLAGYDAVILPGGFSYGDALRPGALARHSPVMNAVEAFARDGGLVLGIGNGFQILCEAGLLPGALLENAGGRFVCGMVKVRVERRDSPFTLACREGEVLSLPIAHGCGRYHADPGALALLESERRILFRYVDDRGEPTHEANPNGSLANIAGVLSREGNVLGMMARPERDTWAVLGGGDGLKIFRSMLGQGLPDGVGRR